MKVVAVRIVGNELPPRDYPGVRFDILKYLLERDEGADRFWIVNHLHDPAYRERVLELLSRHNQPFHELCFEPDVYRALTTRQERLCYAVNINNARNAAVCLTRDHYDFSICLDQDCVFTADLLTTVIDFIRADQALAPERCYYGVMSRRVRGWAIDEAGTLPDGEPMLVFRRDAPLLFDPNVPFGKGEKRRLLNQLGYGHAPDFTLAGDLCRTAGYVVHFQTGPPEAEVDFVARRELRRASLDRLLQELDARYGGLPSCQEP